MSNKMETFDESGWIQTFTCKKFYPLRPKIEDICIEDIAHALSNICRFTGHCQFYDILPQENQRPWSLDELRNRKKNL
jgi:hypothetical protein